MLLIFGSRFVSNYFYSTKTKLVCASFKWRTKSKEWQAHGYKCIDQMICRAHWRANCVCVKNKLRLCKMVFCIDVRFESIYTPKGILMISHILKQLCLHSRNFKNCFWNIKPSCFDLKLDREEVDNVFQNFNHRQDKKNFEKRGLQAKQTRKTKLWKQRMWFIS